MRYFTTLTRGERYEFLDRLMLRLWSQAGLLHRPPRSIYTACAVKFHKTTKQDAVPNSNDIHEEPRYCGGPGGFIARIFLARITASQNITSPV